MTRLLSLDPGLKTFGAALLGPAGALLDIDAIETETGDDVKATRAELRAARKQGRSPKRRKGQKNATDEQLEDRSRRIGEILDWVDEFAYGEDWIAPDIVIAEAGRAMRTGTDGIIAVASGMAIAKFVAWRLRRPLVWATPREWRRSLVPNPADRRAGPSEKEIEAAISTPIVQRVITTLRARGKSISLRGHAIDAFAMGSWSLRSSMTVIEAMRPGDFAKRGVLDDLAVARARKQNDDARAKTEHDWEKSCLVTQRGGFDTYRCKRCGATSKRYGLQWPPRLDAKQPKVCK